MINRFRELNPFHVLHDHLIYRFGTFFYEKHIGTNIYKARIKDLNDLKTRITEEIQGLERKILHNVFLQIRKRGNFCISLEGDTFEQYLEKRSSSNKTWRFFLSFKKKKVATLPSNSENLLKNF